MLRQWYSTSFVRVPPDVNYLQLCTPKLLLCNSSYAQSIIYSQINYIQIKKYFFLNFVYPVRCFPPVHPGVRVTQAEDTGLQTGLPGLDYFHGGLSSRRRRRKCNPVPGGITGWPCHWKIYIQGTGAQVAGCTQGWEPCPIKMLLWYPKKWNPDADLQILVRKTVAQNGCPVNYCYYYY
jgi:hypothetical protein